MRTIISLISFAVFSLLASGCASPYRGVTSLDGERGTVRKLERLTPLGASYAEVVHILRQSVPDNDLYAYARRKEKPPSIFVHLYSWPAYGFPFNAGNAAVTYRFGHDDKLKKIEFQVYYEGA